MVLWIVKINIMGNTYILVRDIILLDYKNQGFKPYKNISEYKPIKIYHYLGISFYC